MALSFQTMFNPLVLTEAYTQRPGAEQYLLTNEFMKSPEVVDGNQVGLTYDPMERSPAPLNDYGAEAKVLTFGQGSEFMATLFHTFDVQRFPGTALALLREPNSMALQSMARTEINKNQAKHIERHRIQKELVLAKILTQGVVYLNAKHQVLESSTGAVQTCDFLVPASRKTNAGGLITASWATTSTDIQNHIETIKIQAAKDGSLPPTEVWANANMLATLRNNTDFITWGAYNQQAQESTLNSVVYPNLWGMNWHFYNAYYQAVDATFKPYIPDNMVIMTPPLNQPWVKASIGSIAVPNQIGIATSIEEALAQCEILSGQYSYAALTHNPLALELYMGDTYGLHFQDVNSIWQLTVVF